MTYPCLRLTLVALGLGVGLGGPGCGLISSDVTNFDLTLPDKKFAIDASTWHLDAAKAPTLVDPDGTLRAVACSSDTMCSSAVQQACTTGCSGSCNASSACDVSLDVGLYQTVDLVTEKPELKTLNDEPVIKVTVDSVTYDVKTNTLNVATPELDVYVAPSSVLRPGDPQAKLIGTIDPIPAGSVTSASKMLKFTATGKAALVDIMSTFKTPFNVLVGSSLRVTAGQQVPAGKLEAVVHIKGHAGL